MKKWMLILLAGVVALVIAIVTNGRGPRWFGRSMTGVSSPAAAKPTGFDPAESVALFVGARTFTEDDALEMVPYAVDDAVDLAYTFALDPRVGLVHANNVMLALSDPMPRKEISRRRLAELKRRGAIVTPATQSKILTALDRQKDRVGTRGIFIVSFASHGFSGDGAQYLLAGNSLFRKFNTAIPAMIIFDLVAQSEAGRSLILIDTCRERVRRQRSGAPEALSAAPLIERMGHAEGQVVLYAAAAGKWAYDDDLRQNGVFTSAVLDGLQCRAGHDPKGMVTVDALSVTVEQSVLTWIRTNRDPLMRNATQISIDGAAKNMPLAICSRSRPSEPPPEPEDAAALPISHPARHTALRPYMEYCREDGSALMALYDTHEPDRFVTTYLQWRDGCVAVLRELDSRLPPREAQESETARFLSTSNLWCATKCPDGLSAGNCALFAENSRAERCFWDLDNALKQVDDIIIRNASVLQMDDSLQGEQP